MLPKSKECVQSLPVFSGILKNIIIQTFRVEILCKQNESFCTVVFIHEHIYMHSDYIYICYRTVLNYTKYVHLMIKLFNTATGITHSAFSFCMYDVLCKRGLVAYTNFQVCKSSSFQPTTFISYSAIKKVQGDQISRLYHISYRSKTATGFKYHAFVKI